MRLMVPNLRVYLRVVYTRHGTRVVYVQGCIPGMYPGGVYTGVYTRHIAQVVYIQVYTRHIAQVVYTQGGIAECTPPYMPPYHGTGVYTTLYVHHVHTLGTPAATAVPARSAC